MKSPRETRLVLGWLALAAPLPLPFNKVLAWPLLFLFAAVVVAFLQRAERGEDRWLPNWVLNILGGIYLPLLFFDLRSAIWRGRVVTALLHLLLFVVAVKLWSMRRESDKWLTLVATFFLFVGSMATSSHVTVALYLVGFGSLALWGLSRLASLHEGLPVRMAGAGGPPRRRSVEPARWARGLRPLGALLIVLAVTVPIFALVPRLQQPFVLGRGAGGASMARSTGFSDVVDLNMTTSIRANRSVALRIQYEDPLRIPDSPRFKAASYEWYVDRSWHRAPSYLGVSVPRNDEGFFVGRPTEGTHRADVYQEPISSASLILPVEAQRVELDGVPHLMRDPGGAVYLPGVPRDTFRFSVVLGDEFALEGRFEDPRAPEAVTALDEGGITPRIRELAAEILSEAGTAEEKVDRLERHLMDRYEYTLDYLGRDGDHPIEDFLFVHRSGHCELFASAMVLLLRAEGVPARLATGFLGAEYNPLEDYYIVRQQSAHAWVEAWTEDRGWAVYDPTPPNGRPTVAEQSLALYARQFYDWVNFRWDRYVLTYGAADQEDLLRGLRERFSRWWAWLTDPEEAEALAPLGLDAPSPDATFGSPEEGDVRDFEVPLPLIFAFLSVVFGAGVFWARRGPPPVGQTWSRARRWLVQQDVAVEEATPPVELVERLVGRWRSAEIPARRLVTAYLRESFAAEASDRSQRRQATEDFRAIRRSVAEERRQERRERRGRRPVPAT